MPAPASTLVPEFSMLGRGPLEFLLGAPGVDDRPTPRMFGWAVLVALVAWLPPLALAALRGDLLGTHTPAPYLTDLTAYARYLVAIPLFVLIAPLLDFTTRITVRELRETALLPDDERDAFDAGVRAAMRVRDAWWIPLLLVVVITAATRGLMGSRAGTSLPSWSWQDMGAGPGITPAGQWVSWVSQPMLYFLALYWALRLGAWGLLLLHTARLKLELVATHPDGAAGLSFLGEAQMRMALVLVPLSVIVSAALAQQARLHGSGLLEMRTVLGTYVVVAMLVLIAPLLSFIPRLARVRRAQLLEYSRLAKRYGSGFHRKWIIGPSDEPLLGSSDIQSLADLGTSYERVDAMRGVPLSVHAAIAMLLTLTLPMLPCVLTVVPLQQLLTQLLQLVR